MKNQMASWCIDEMDGSKSVFIHLPGLVAESGQNLYNELSRIPDSEWIQGKFMQHLTPRLVRWHKRESSNTGSGATPSPLGQVGEI